MVLISYAGATDLGFQSGRGVGAMTRKTTVVLIMTMTIIMTMMMAMTTMMTMMIDLWWGA